eukprot:jgi/Hompol1/4663/HPOL_002479-RA
MPPISQATAIAAATFATPEEQAPPLSTNYEPFMDIRPLHFVPSISQPRDSPLPMRWTRTLPFAESNSTLLPTRSHSTALVNGVVFVFGGCDDRACRNTVCSFDPDTNCWREHDTFGAPPLARRAHSMAAFKHFLIIFGGGDGPTYFGDVAVLDTLTFHWLSPTFAGTDLPKTRRAHSSWVYKDAVYIYAGGDGSRALTDVWRLVGLQSLSTEDPYLTWQQVETTGPVPAARGYHTTTLFGNQVVLYGGSDARECFSDIWSLNLDSQEWTQYRPTGAFPNVPRLAHASCSVGPYLFVVGGHDGVKYSRDIRILDVRTMHWLDDTSVQRKWIQHAARPQTIQPISTSVDLNGSTSSLNRQPSASGNTRGLEDAFATLLSAGKISPANTAPYDPMATMGPSRSPSQLTKDRDGADGTLPLPGTLSNGGSLPAPARRQRIAPSGRGYHSLTVCGDRIILFGGFNGVQVYDDIWILDLGFRSYLLNASADRSVNLVGSLVSADAGQTADDHSDQSNDGN